MALRFPCPTCKRELTGPESVAGLEVQCPSCRAVFVAAKRADPEPPPFIPSRQWTPIPRETTEWAAPEPPLIPAADPFPEHGQAGDVGLPINQQGDPSAAPAIPLNCNFEPLFVTPLPAPGMAAQRTTTAEVVPVQPPSWGRRWLWTLLLVGELLVGRALVLWRKERADLHDEKDRTRRGLITAILVSVLIIVVAFALVVLLGK
jgi:hypothetical protein